MIKVAQIHLAHFRILFLKFTSGTPVHVIASLIEITQVEILEGYTLVSTGLIFEIICFPKALIVGDVYHDASRSFL